jgi:hypothetical protein
LVDKVHYYAFLKINFAGVYSGKGAEWQQSSWQIHDRHWTNFSKQDNSFQL